MMFTIGAFIILLAFLMDDVTTYILMLKGWGVLESNPFYLQFGFAGMFGITIVLYLFLIVTWKFVIVTYRKVVLKKYFYRKWYDVFIFFFCFIIINLATIKILCGIGTMGLLIDHAKGGPTADAIDQMVADHTELKSSDPVRFGKQMLTLYKDTVMQVTYFQQVFNVLAAFLLFKVGYKVVPWDLA